jgi:release factor glutamine methyltransferase
MMSKIRHLLQEGSGKIEKISDSPGLDAEIVLAHLLNISRFDLLSNGQSEVDTHISNRFNELIERRMKGEPVAYIVNEKPFFEDVFYVDERVLVPRPETEFLVMEAIDYLKEYKKRPSVLDICCGSGCVGLSVLRVVDCDLTMSDISQNALEVAKINVEKLFPQNLAVKLIKSDLFENINEKYDIITANPPYLSESDMKEFVYNELKYEPQKALFGGEKGIEITEKILNQAHNYLNPDGMIAIELGFEGSKHLKKHYEKLKLKKITKDYNNIERIAIFSPYKL